MVRGIAMLIWLYLGVPACAGASEPAPGDSRLATKVERGKATWYGGKFHGRKTASGERFDKRKLTAAHRTLPFGSMVRVTNQLTGKSVTVRINDRGPFSKGRIIDVSEAAAKKLDMIGRGVVPVTIHVVSRP